MDPLSDDRDVNDDDWTPDFSWPCPFDDPNNCWWDYGPPSTASSPTGAKRELEVRVAKPRKLTLFGDKDPAKFTVSVSSLVFLIPLLAQVSATPLVRSSPPINI